MPTPLDLILDPVSLAAFASFAALMAWESIAPARRLPKAPVWRLRGLLAFATYFLVSSYLPLWWGPYLAPLQLFDLTAFGTAGGPLVGILVYELIAYAWHRSMHASTLLWRGVHQMHHSAERIDTFSAFWFSPLDMAGWTAVMSLALALVGLAPQAITAVLLTVNLIAILGHTNVRTPRWLGYIVQRPENHAWHHARGEHRGNYADVSLIDMLFGTFRNPPDFPPATGFHEGASLRVLDMLRFRDVDGSASTAAAATR
ncbi:MAG TPA: sterol desaturase family protein [Mizugakiibacter sp.]